MGTKLVSCWNASAKRCENADLDRAVHASHVRPMIESQSNGCCVKFFKKEARVVIELLPEALMGHSFHLRKSTTQFREKVSTFRCNNVV